MPRTIQRVGNILIASVMLMGLWGFGKEGNRNQAVAQPDRISQAQMQNLRLVKANTRFGFKLFSEIVKRQPNQNIFLSPMSVVLALTMAYTGANGETQQAMAKTLELQGMSLGEIQQATANLKLTLENNSDIQLNLANALWVNQQIQLRREFLQTNQKFFGAQITNLNFGSSDALNQINHWVSQQTNGKIRAIIDEILPNDLLILVNAIYFQGNWSYKFNPQLTQTHPFYLSRDRQKLHPMMSQTQLYPYWETAKFQAISLPYGQGQFSLYLFLPNSNSSLNAFYQELNAQTWEQWMWQFTESERSSIRSVDRVTLLLPRFKLEYEIELSQVLTALGMGIAFSPTADFSAMTSEAAAIGLVKHKTFVEVNEQGTEAAAATSVSATRSAMSPVEMIVDRPFFFVIRDDESGTILFMGSIVDPQS